MRFTFITRESRNEPGARTRCWGYSDKLKERGFQTSVFSFPDKLGAKSGKDDHTFGLKDKLACLNKGFRLLLKEKSSVFVVNRFNYHAVSAWLASKIKKVPFIFDMDDWEARESAGSKSERLCRLFAKQSRFCIAASSYLQDYLCQFNRKVYCLPTAVDTDKFKPSPYRNKKGFIFSWHGSINRPEIVSYLKFAIECFLTLHNKYPFIKFFIAGNGIFEKETAELIKSYCCKDLVYKGRIDFKNMPSYLDGIDAGIVPLLDKSRFNLSKSPVKLFEYMAKAKPVIASRVGEAKRIVKNGYNGFLASQSQEFIFCMERLIRNKKLRREIGLKAREQAEKKYSLDVLGEKFFNIFRDDFNSSFNF